MNKASNSDQVHPWWWHWLSRCGTGSSLCGRYQTQRHAVQTVSSSLSTGCICTGGRCHCDIPPLTKVSGCSVGSRCRWRHLGGPGCGPEDTAENDCGRSIERRSPSRQLASTYSQQIFRTYSVILSTGTRSNNLSNDRLWNYTENELKNTYYDIASVGCWRLFG